MIGEKPSTVRYILKRGTTADWLTWYLPDQKRWEYFDLSPVFAVEETRRRCANKGPRGKVSNFFDGHRSFFRQSRWHPHPCRPQRWRPNNAPLLL